MTEQLIHDLISGVISVSTIGQIIDTFMFGCILTAVYWLFPSNQAETVRGSVYQFIGFQAISAVVHFGLMS